MNFPEPCPFCFDPDSHNECTCPAYCGASSFCAHEEKQGAKSEVFDRPEIRDAIRLLRGHGVGASQYLFVRLAEDGEPDG